MAQKTAPSLESIELIAATIPTLDPDTQKTLNDLLDAGGIVEVERMIRLTVAEREVASAPPPPPPQPGWCATAPDSYATGYHWPKTQKELVEMRTANPERYRAAMADSLFNPFTLPPD